ncbi:MAG: SH3 domain-containing protein [Anaerolineae bacterium]|nr:SH3 domain-containing protein [Anaerolineae bacterium]
MTHRSVRALLAVLCAAMLITILTPANPVSADTGSNWTGSYYPNPYLQGNPVFTRIDPAVVFNWGPNPPGPGLGSQFWSARWVTIQYLAAGTYRFTVTSDDGVRVYINGQIILDAWRDQAPTTYNVNVQVPTGNHAIQVDYYQGIGDASLSVSWNPLLTPSSAWTAQYYNNPDLAGAPVISRYEGGINYFWGLGSPDPAVAPDNFSARWTITTPFNAGTYRFTLAGDDGIRLFIDNILVINQWKDQVLTAYTIDVTLTAGLHTLRVEYYDRVGQATVRLVYEPAVGPPGDGQTQWYGEYFANPFLAGSPTFVRLDGSSGIDKNWSTQAPVAGFPRENFSVRWTRQICVPGRPYTIYLTADDGVRLYIDVTLVIDAWRVQDRVTIRQPVDLTAGCHNFRLEYFQATGNSVVNLTWEPPDGQNPPQYVAPPPPPSGVNAVVQYASRLNVRTGPGINYGIITTIDRNTVLALSARNADASWVRVTTLPGGTVGWVSRAYLQITSGNVNSLPVQGGGVVDPGNPTGVRVRTLTTVRLRSGAGTQHSILGNLGWGVVLDVIGRNSDNSWLQVRFGTVVGWVYSPYLQVIAGNLYNVPVTG